MANHMARRRWGQRSLHNAPFRAAVSEVFMLLSLGSDTSLVSSSGCLSPPLSYFLSLSFSPSASFSLRLSVSFSLCFHFFSFLPPVRWATLPFALPPSETQDPSQMGVLINSRLRVTHILAWKEEKKQKTNACMASTTAARLPQGMLQQEGQKSCSRRAEH